MIDDNYTKVPNAVIEKLMKGLTFPELKVLLLIHRKTIGYQKEWDKISLSQFEEVTGGGRGHINEALKSLEDRKIIQADRSGYTNAYKLNVDSSEWEPVPNGNHNSSDREPKQFRQGTGSSSQREPTKEKKEILKETIKESNPAAVEVAEYLLESIQNWEPTHKYNSNPPAIGRWCKDIEKAMRIDGRSQEQLMWVIDFLFTQNNEVANFWAPNIQSGKKLRSKFDKIVGQAKRMDPEKNGKINVGKLQSQLDAAFKENARIGFESLNFD